MEAGMEATGETAAMAVEAAMAAAETVVVEVMAVAAEATAAAAEAEMVEVVETAAEVTVVGAAMAEVEMVAEVVTAEMEAGAATVAVTATAEEMAAEVVTVAAAVTAVMETAGSSTGRRYKNVQSKHASRNLDACRWRSSVLDGFRTESSEIDGRAEGSIGTGDRHDPDSGFAGGTRGSSSATESHAAEFLTARLASGV
jgi:hypothetical protein